MPTGVTYHDEKTINEVYTALFGNNDMDFPQVLAAVSRLQNAGILFRKDVPEELRPSRGPRTPKGDAAMGTVSVGEYDPSLPVTPDAQ